MFDTLKRPRYTIPWIFVVSTTLVYTADITHYAFWPPVLCRRWGFDTCSHEFKGLHSLGSCHLVDLRPWDNARCNMVFGKMPSPMTFSSIGRRNPYCCQTTSCAGNDPRSRKGRRMTTALARISEWLTSSSNWPMPTASSEQDAHGGRQCVSMYLSPSTCWQTQASVGNDNIGLATVSKGVSIDPGRALLAEITQDVSRAVRFVGRPFGAIR